MLYVYLYIFITLAGTVLSQLLLKYGIAHVGNMPSGLWNSLLFLTKVLLNPVVILAFLVVFVASLAWIAVLSKAELSFAYPFMSLAPALVLLFSSFLLKEQPSSLRWLGVAVIGIGVFIVSRS